MISRRSIKRSVWASISRQMADDRPRSLLEVGTGIVVLLGLIWLLFA